MKSSGNRISLTTGVAFEAVSPEGLKVIRDCFDGAELGEITRDNGHEVEPEHEECPGFLTPQQVRLEVDAEQGTAFDMTQALYCGFGDDPEAEAIQDRVGYYLPTQPMVWDFDPSSTFNPYLLR